MAVDAAFNVYVADNQLHERARVTALAVVTTLGGSGQPPPWMVWAQHLDLAACEQRVHPFLKELHHPLLLY